MKKTMCIILALFLSLGVHVSHAQEDTLRSNNQIPYMKEYWGKFLEPDVGDKLVPRGKVEAWESYPSGLFFDRGNRYGEIEPGREYTVTGRKSLPNIFWGDNYFIHIKPSDPKSIEDPCLKGCWVYQGKGDTKLPESLLAPEYSVPPVQ